MARAGRPDPRRLLRRLAADEVWPKARAAALDLAYRGPADFVLQHGEWHDPAPLPDHVGRGLAGHCYHNAILVAVRHGLDYVEGLALDPDLRTAYPHAWNVGPDGAAVDSTWTGDAALVVREGRPTLFVGMPGAAYLGVRFAVERADDCTWDGDAHVLGDARRGWPVLRRRWEGERAGPWPPSPRLDAYRAFAAGDRAPLERLHEVLG